jgi:hypothetical protein
MNAESFETLPTFKFIFCNNYSFPLKTKVLRAVNNRTFKPSVCLKCLPFSFYLCIIVHVDTDQGNKS